MALSDYSVERIKIYESGKMRAFVDMRIGPVVIKGFKIMDGPRGLWLAKPQVKRKNSEEWDDILYLTKADGEDMQQVAVNSYYRETGKAGGEDPDIPFGDGKVHEIGDPPPRREGERTERGLRTEDRLRQ